MHLLEALSQDHEVDRLREKVGGMVSAFAAMVAFAADIVLSPALMALATRSSEQRESPPVSNLGDRAGA